MSSRIQRRRRESAALHPPFASTSEHHELSHGKGCRRTPGRQSTFLSCFNSKDSAQRRGTFFCVSFGHGHGVTLLLRRLDEKISVLGNIGAEGLLVQGAPIDPTERLRGMEEQPG